MNNLFKINGNPEQYEDLDVFHKLAQQFLPYAQQSLGFDKPVGVNLLSDPENVKDPLGKTAYYDPNKMEITLFVDKRHVKDVLRSMAHELVHHTQNCRGEFDGGVHTGPGYAQDDEHMRKMEAEAYLKGSGFLLRDWEDSLKENKTMSKKRLKEVVNVLDRNDPGYEGPPSPQEIPKVDFSIPKRGAEEFRVAMKQAGLSDQEIANVFGNLSEPPVTSGVEDLDVAGLTDRLSGVVARSQGRKAAKAMVPKDALAKALGDDDGSQTAMKMPSAYPPETPLFGDDPEDRAMATGGKPGATLEESDGDKTSDSLKKAQEKARGKEDPKKEFDKIYDKKGDKTSDSWKKAQEKARGKELSSLEEGEGDKTSDSWEQAKKAAKKRADAWLKKRGAKVTWTAAEKKEWEELQKKVEVGLDEGADKLCEDCGKMHEGGCMEETKNENWFKGNKDQLLFERLVSKWAK